MLTSASMVSMRSVFSITVLIRIFFLLLIIKTEKGFYLDHKKAQIEFLT